MTVRMQVAFPMKLDDVGADVIQNTWHFDPRGVTTPLAAAQAFRGDVENSFYKGFDEFLSDEVIENFAVVNAYDLDDPEPRSPIFTDSLDITAGSGTPLPAHLAICVSYQAAFVSGQPKGRRRGRIYTGGFLTTGLSTTDGRVGSALIDALVSSADALLTASDASDDYQWQVYSPTDAVSRPVIGGWVDNSWDTQRRRKLEPSSRNPWGLGL